VYSTSAISLVWPRLNAVDSVRMDFSYYDTIEDALAIELGGRSRDAEVGVLTRGSVSLPIV